MVNKNSKIRSFFIWHTFRKWFDIFFLFFTRGFYLFFWFIVYLCWVLSTKWIKRISLSETYVVCCLLKIILKRKQKGKDVIDFLYEDGWSRKAFIIWNGTDLYGYSYIKIARRWNPRWNAKITCNEKAVASQKAYCRPKWLHLGARNAQKLIISLRINLL